MVEVRSLAQGQGLVIGLVGFEGMGWGVVWAASQSPLFGDNHIFLLHRSALQPPGDLVPVSR